MSLPEQGSREFTVLMQQVHKRLMVAVGIVATVRKNLPPKAHALTYDKDTQEIFMTNAGIRYLPNGNVHITTDGVSGIRPGFSAVDFANDWAEERGVLVCDEKIVELINATKVEDNHYAYTGQRGGTLEIYVPPLGLPMDKRNLPPGTIGGFQFKPYINPN